MRLIQDGELHAHVPGAVRRKLRLVDVLAYRDELRARRNRFITETSAEFVPNLQPDVLLQLATEEAFAPLWGTGTLAELDHTLARIRERRGIADSEDSVCRRRIS